MANQKGRPKLSADEGRRVMVSVRVSAEEKKEIDAAAQRAKEKPAAWRRNALLAASRKVNCDT